MDTNSSAAQTPASSITICRSICCQLKWTVLLKLGSTVQQLNADIATQTTKIVHIFF